VQQGYDVQGLFVGAGHENGSVRQIARDLGVDARISMLGPRDDVQALMPGLDVYALSSAWGEAFPLAVTEAMACGVPAVVTDVGDCAWLVGETGIAVPRKDCAALAAALSTILDLDPGARRDLGMRARQRVIENFSLQRYVSRHQELYEGALGRTALSERHAI
jgi:glycosyltransferase involved in cell wall biosynthesis